MYAIPIAWIIHESLRQSLKVMTKRQSVDLHKKQTVFEVPSRLGLGRLVNNPGWLEAFWCSNFMGGLK
jgi:hypothetical protein